MDKVYFYKAFVTSVYDGDTITCNIDCGFGIILKKQKIRLYGINTPEIRGEEKEEGKKSRDFLRNLILEKDIILETYKGNKKGKYGRWLGVVHLDNIDINQKLVNENYAINMEY